jgi:RNA polymerase-binding transcription factor DksA
MTFDSYSEFKAALNRLKMRLANGGGSDARLRVTMPEVEAALKRIEDGTYGICNGCFLVMPKGELLMRPHATVCGGCRSRQVRAA